MFQQSGQCVIIFDRMQIGAVEICALEVESIVAPNAHLYLWVTNSHLEFYEKLFQKVTSQGAASFSQQHRDLPDSKPTEEEYQSWSFGEKREFTINGKRPDRR